MSEAKQIESQHGRWVYELGSGIERYWMDETYETRQEAVDAGLAKLATKKESDGCHGRVSVGRLREVYPSDYCSAKGIVDQIEEAISESASDEIGDAADDWPWNLASDRGVMDAAEALIAAIDEATTDRRYAIDDSHLVNLLDFSADTKG